MTKKKTPSTTAAALPDAAPVPTIREFILGCPADLPAAGVVKEAKKVGIKTTPQYVYRVRSLAGKKKSKVSKASAKAAVNGMLAHAAGTTSGAPAPKSALEIVRTSVKALGVLVDSGFMSPKDAWTFLANL